MHKCLVIVSVFDCMLVCAAKQRNDVLYERHTVRT